MNNFLWIWAVSQLVFISYQVTAGYNEEANKKSPYWIVTPQDSYRNLTLGETHYLISETTKKLSQSLRESLLTNPLIQERVVVCLAPFLCSMRDPHSYYDFIATKCRKMHWIKRLTHSVSGTSQTSSKYVLPNKEQRNTQYLTALCGVPISSSTNITSSKQSLLQYKYNIFSFGLWRKVLSNKVLPK